MKTFMTFAIQKGKEIVKEKLVEIIVARVMHHFRSDNLKMKKKKGKEEYKERGIWHL